MSTAAIAATGIGSARVNRAELAAALRAAATIKSKTVELTFGEGQLVVSGYEHDAAVRATITAPVETPGSFAVARTALANALAYCGASIDIHATPEDCLQLVSGPSEFQLPAVAEHTTYGHDFASDYTTPVTLEAPVLVEALRRVLPLVGRDETRPVLTQAALYPGRNLIVGTDSYRLAVVRYGDDGPAEQPVLLARAGADSLKRLLAKKLGTVEIAASHERVHVRFDELEWSLRASTAYRGAKDRMQVFPSWEGLLPADSFTTIVKVDREDVLLAARAAAQMATNHAPLRLTISAGAARTVLGSNGDRCSMRRALETAEVQGDDIEIGVNPAFLADIAASAPVERLTLKLLGPLRPMTIEAARDAYLLMPIRLNT